MGTTPKGIRYPEPTAPVRNGAADMATLSGDVDTRLTLVESTTGSRIVGARIITRTVNIALNQFGQGSIPYVGTPLANIWFATVTRVVAAVPGTDTSFFVALYTSGSPPNVPGPSAVIVVRNGSGALIVNTTVSVAVLLIGSE
jgi:hypothetical protein